MLKAPDGQRAAQLLHDVGAGSILPGFVDIHAHAFRQKPIDGLRALDAQAHICGRDGRRVDFDKSGADADGFGKRVRVRHVFAHAAHHGELR